jgi:ferrous-iron efflux pump FieF
MPDMTISNGNQARNGQLMRWATFASTSVALLLIAAKTAAWLMTDSVSMLSSLLDSSLDLVASLVTLLSVHYALTPADREHRFGHGKAEALAGLIQSGFIGASAIWLFTAAVERLIHPRPMGQELIGIVVMVVSIVLTFVLVMFQRRVVRRTASIAVGADQAHYQSDLITNLGVILAIVLTKWANLPIADPIIAIAIGLYILKGAADIARNSYHELLDREFSDDERERIKAIVRGHAEVRDMHDLRTRSSGPNRFIQFHMELDPDLSLSKAHVISDQVESQLLEAFPNAEIIIHEDPQGVIENRASFT